MMSNYTRPWPECISRYNSDKQIVKSDNVLYGSYRVESVDQQVVFQESSDKQIIIGYPAAAEL